MANRIDDKSVCEIFIKVFNEILNQSTNSSVPGLKVNLKGSTEDLQQSGQSNEAIPDQTQANEKVEKVQKKLKDVITLLLEKKLDESASIYDKYGAIDVL